MTTTVDAPAETQALQIVPISHIDVNPNQVRTIFDEDEIASLAVSIRAVGLLQPILVMRDGLRYTLIAGERRLRACRHLGLETIEALVREPVSDEDSRLAALLENAAREDLNPMELGAAYREIMEERGLTIEQLSQLIGVNYRTVTLYLRMRDLPESVQRRISSKVLTFGHAKALLPLLKDEKAREFIVPLAEQATGESLTVRQLEERVSMVMHLQADRPRKRRARGVTPRTPRLEGVQAALRDRLDTKVTVSGDGRKGNIVIPYGGDGDLERLCSLLNVDLQIADNVDLQFG